MPDIFDQSGYDIRLDWGRRGAVEAAGRGDILIVVDVLSFSSAVVTGVHGGASIYPCGRDEDPNALAGRLKAEAAVGRAAVPDEGRFSLSPLTWLGAEVGDRVVLASPNGATCASAARKASAVFAGGLLNASAVAHAAQREHAKIRRPVTVIACGEIWSGAGDQPMRVALEDALGAGAILRHLSGDKSPEARVCENAFESSRTDLEALMWECGSGRELREKGFSADIRHASRLNLYDVAPILRNGWFERA